MFSLVVVNVYAANSRCYFHDINLILMITNVMNLLIKKIDLYILSRFDEDMQCDAVTIRELCESRDSCDDLMYDRSELQSRSSCDDLMYDRSKLQSRDPCDDLMYVRS